MTPKEVDVKIGNWLLDSKYDKTYLNCLNLKVIPGTKGIAEKSVRKMSCKKDMLSQDVLYDSVTYRLPVKLLSSEDCIHRDYNWRI